MRRAISFKLTEWSSGPFRKPLLIRGARQVGKTYIVNQFASQHFKDNFHSFNFEKNPELHTLFDQNLDSTRIVSELELFSGKRIDTEHDLLFFDEIQECPKAIMALRYFYEEMPGLRIIAAGSLLEFASNDISFPVGILQILQMHPMTFGEFLIATGKEILAERIREPDRSISESAINLINEEMYNYFLTGGMPESVNAFRKTGSFIESFKIQENLLATLRQDFAKYAGHSDKRCLNAVLGSVAKKTGEQIKYTHLAEDFSQPTIKKAFELLEMARLFTKVKAASPAGIPLGEGASEKIFKTLFLDIGLLSNISGFSADRTVPKNKMASAFNGKLAEQFVGQELRARLNENVYYWSRNQRGSSAETDYLIEKNGEILPVEVKSGKSGKIKSLHLLLKEYPSIRQAYVLTEDKFGDIPDQKIKFRPLFFAAYLP